MKLVLAFSRFTIDFESGKKREITQWAIEENVSYTLLLVIFCFLFGRKVVPILDCAACTDPIM